MKMIFYGGLFYLFAMAGELQAQQVQVIKFKDLKNLENKKNDTTYVFNFWATWCRPCVKELPFFDSLTEKFAGEKISVILISLDFIRQFDTRLMPFVKENKLSSSVFLLDEPDYNSWISMVDSSWSGSIPATLIINNKNGVRKFYEQEFSEEELHKTIKKFIY